MISDGSQLLMCWEKHIQKWMLPGGTLEPGEGVKACLRRELQEEIGLDLAIGPLLGCLEWHWHDRDHAYQEFDFIFRMKLPAGLLGGTVMAKESHLDFQTLLMDDLHTLPHVAPPGIAALIAEHYHREGVYEFVSS